MDADEPKRLILDELFLHGPEEFHLQLGFKTREEFAARARELVASINRHEAEYSDPLAMLRAFLVQMGIEEVARDIMEDSEPLSEEESADLERKRAELKAKS
jgi:hypothetical protein